MEPLYNGNHGDGSELNGRIGWEWDAREAGVDVVFKQTFLPYYVNQVILMLTGIFQ